MLWTPSNDCAIEFALPAATSPSAPVPAAAAMDDADPDGEPSKPVPDAETEAAAEVEVEEWVGDAGAPWSRVLLIKGAKSIEK